MNLGIQLYNFREELNVDFVSTLREIAKLGYSGVEFAASYGNIAPDELASLLKELGLQCCGTMFSANDLLDEKNIAYEYAKALQSPAVTISASGDFTQIWKEVAERCRKIGDIASRQGVLFSYHNHWNEFADVEGTCAMERILAETDPGKVFMEPDVCWLTRGGVDPSSFIRRHAKRIRQVHLKDSKVPDVREELTELGNGVVDLKGAYLAAKEAGASWVIYEQDVTSDPFGSARISLEYLKKLQSC